MYFTIIKKQNKFLITAPHGSRKLLKGIAEEPGDRGSDYLAEILAEKLNASAIIANYSRLIIDFNRPKDECISSKFYEYEIPKPNPKESEERLQAYDEYNNALKDLIHTNTMHLSLHTMLPIGPKGSLDEDKERPDFRLSTREQSTIDMNKVEKIKTDLEKNNFTVEVDNIFMGKDEIRRTREYGAESLQIEINSNLLLKDDNKPYQEKEYDKLKIEKLASILSKVLHQSQS